MRRQGSKHMVYSAILVAFGILIPLVMPIKIVIGPASYTLASHVPLFMAMLISPPVAVFVALGTAIGFLLAGFPLVVVCRAVSHLLFVTIGAIWVKKQPQLLSSPYGRLLLALCLNLIHGVAEFIVVYFLTSGTVMTLGYAWTLFLLTAVGSLLHGLIDFYLAYFLINILEKRMGLNWTT